MSIEDHLEEIMNNDLPFNFQQLHQMKILKNVQIENRLLIDLTD